MGVTFDNEKQMFVFDFEHDGAEDIVNLTGDGYQVEAFGKCFYYGYEFSDQVDGNVRSAFIKYVKFTDELQDNPDLTQFIKKAIDILDRKINLWSCPSRPARLTNTCCVISIVLPNLLCVRWNW